MQAAIIYNVRMAPRKKTDEFGNDIAETDETVAEAAVEQVAEPIQEEAVVEPAPVEPEPVVEAVIEPVVEIAPVVEEPAKSNPVSSAVKLAGDIVKAHRPTRLGRTRCC